MDIVEARETSDWAQKHEQRSGGLSVGVSVPIVGAAQSIASTASATAHTGSDRMQALGAAATGLQVYNAAQGLIKNPSQALGASVYVSLGSSHSESRTEGHSDSARASNVAAGGNVTIAATGAGADSNLLIRGSNINAGGDATLVADNRIDVLAARQDSEQHSENKGSSASIGISYGPGGLLVNVGASASRGNGDGQDTTYVHSHVNAGNTLTLSSGGDTNIIGSQLSGNSVKADVGGNLTLANVQDSSTSSQKEQSAGGSVSVGVGVWSASASFSNSNAHGNYTSVTEQAGIAAGDGGFDVQVKGQTTLTGATITSTQAALDAGKNNFNSEGGLTLNSLTNTSDYDAKGFGVTAGLSGGKDAKGNAVTGKPTGSMGAGEAGGHETSNTQSGITGIAGDTEVRTGKDSTKYVFTPSLCVIEAREAAQSRSVNPKALASAKARASCQSRR